MANTAYWTMVTETINAKCYHIAGLGFVSLCGRTELSVRDYCEWINGALWRIGEAGTPVDSKPVDEFWICKKCIHSIKNIKP